MRLSISLVALLSTAASAQQNGAWTGYVRGWVNDTPRPIVRYPTSALVAPNPYWVLAAQQAVANQTYVEEAARVAKRERDAADRERASQEDLMLRERQLADERVNVADRQRLAAERELAAQQQKLAEAQEAAAIQLAAAAEQQRDAAKQLAAATEAARAKEKDEAVKAAADQKRAAAPEVVVEREKGPEIHRWVDDDGTIIYSTKPPPAPRARSSGEGR